MGTEKYFVLVGGHPKTSLAPGIQDPLHATGFNDHCRHREVTLQLQLCFVPTVVGYTMDTLYFTWIENPVDIEKNLEMPQFSMEGFVQNDCSQNYTAGKNNAPPHQHTHSTLTDTRGKQ